MHNQKTQRCNHRRRVKRLSFLCFATETREWWKGSGGIFFLFVSFHISLELCCPRLQCNKEASKAHSAIIVYKLLSGPATFVKAITKCLWTAFVNLRQSNHISVWQDRYEDGTQDFCHLLCPIAICSIQAICSILSDALDNAQASQAIKAVISVHASWNLTAS